MKELVAEGSPPVWTNWQHKTKGNVGLAGEGAEITERLKFRKKPSNHFSFFCTVVFWEEYLSFVYTIMLRLDAR